MSYLAIGYGKGFDWFGAFLKNFFFKPPPLTKASAVKHTHNDRKKLAGKMPTGVADRNRTT